MAATPALREREMAKTASLNAAVAQALCARGVAEDAAELAAEIGMAAFARATRRWIEEPDTPLDTLLTRAFDDLRGLVRR